MSITTFIKRSLLLTLSFCVFSLAHLSAQVDEESDHDLSQYQEQPGDNNEKNHEQLVEHTSPHATPAFWSMIPFVILLLMIATGPLFYEHFWHSNYPKITVVLALLVVIYYLFALHNTHSPIHALFEYVQFIALLSSLYIASGGIMIYVFKEGKPFTNITILLIGAVIANLIGTTGASMLLIRPFVRVNRSRIKPYHIVFFIFIVSNIGGSLTPIGDPPLFLGFLKGVPFFWTLTNNFFPWLFALIALLVIFYLLDIKNKANYFEGEVLPTVSNKVIVIGNRNFFWLLLIIISVFIDPNIFPWVPGISYQGQQFSFIREIIMFSVAFLSYKFANKKALSENEFSFEPIREVAFIFIGIFGTMMPALELVSLFAESDKGTELISHNTLYWGTGLLSGFLDNAPTYLNFLAAALASEGASITNITEVVAFAKGGKYSDSLLQLKAISIAAVFFGAFTYIGNGPNFMVKSISEEIGIKMPSFLGYIIRFSIPFLLPLLLLTWLIFFWLA